MTMERNELRKAWEVRVAGKGAAQRQRGGMEVGLLGKSHFRGSSYRDEGNFRKKILGCSPVSCCFSKRLLTLRCKAFLQLDSCFFWTRHSAKTSPKVAQLYSGFISIYSVHDEINDLAVQQPFLVNSKYCLFPWTIEKNTLCHFRIFMQLSSRNK